MAIGNSNDLTHIVRTSDQWKNTYDKYELIPVGVLCVELVSSDVTKIKIGDGHNIFSKLPYIGDLDLSKYYTKLETDTRIKEILTQEKVVRIKGIIGSKSDLPADARCGDIYFVRQLSSSDNKYIEYIYSPDNTWEPLGGIPVDIDLSEYAKTAYVDDKIEQVNERIDDIEQHGTHTHSNKEILDQITEPYTTADKETLASLHNYDDTEIREMISQSSHTHANKDILDATSAAFTREDKSKLDQLNPYDDSTIKERITELERVAHEHSNKRILDRTTASFTTEYERKMRWIRMYTGCTGMEEGIAGLVPAAQAGEEDYVLSGSGEWVPQTGGGGTYELPIATTSTLGGIKVGDGLEIDANGKLSVVGGGGGGDSIAEGDGITITTDPQTGVKTISVNTGDHLSVDSQTGELNVSGVMEEFNIGKGLELVLPTIDTLPAGYGHVDYVKTSGAAYAYLDYYVTVNTKVVGTATCDTFNNDAAVFGTRQGLGRNEFVMWMQQQTTNPTNMVTGFVYGSNSWGTSTDANNGRTAPYHQGDQYNFEASVAGGLKINNQLLHNVTNNGNPSSTKLCVFACNGYSGGIYNGKMYQFKLYENDTLSAKLIPAVRLSDNAVGFYDVINDIFYTSSASTPFTTDMSTLIIDDPTKVLNAKIGNGLQFDSNDAIEVNTGDGLSINQDNELEVNLGSGLSFNQDGEIEADQYTLPTASASTLGGIKVGDGLSIESDGTLSVVGGGGSGGGSEYAEGDAIEIDTQTLSFNVDAIRWDISDIKSIYQQGGPYTQMRSVEFCDSSNVAHTLDSGSAIWDDGDTVSYATVSETIDELVANTGKMCAVWRYPNYALKLTFNLDTVTPLSDIVKFRMKTANDTPERDPKAWKIYVRNATTQQWYLVHETLDAEITGTRDTWSDYYAFTPVTETSINVKYGDGLSIDENGALSTTTYLAGDGIELNPYGGLVVENTEYYFDTPVSCEIRGSFNRTFQKTTADPALGVIWKCYDNNKLWGGPLFVGLTADSVKYTTEGTTYNAKGTFTYLGKTWYYSDTSYYVQNPQDHDYLGNLEVFTDVYDYVTDEVDAAKRLIDTAHVYTNNLEEISVKIGQRLKIEADGSVNAKGYLEGEGISIDTTDYLLPTGYTRIKALSSTLNGNQYINTGYKLNPNTIIDMKCTLYKRGTSVWAIPLGARVYNSYGVGGMLFVTTNSDNLVPSTGVDTPSLWIENSLNYPPAGQIDLWYNDIIDLHFDNQSVTCENQRTGEQSVITSQTAISATSNYDLYVFATNNGNNAAFFGVMDLYELTISENNIIIHRYIPCKRDSDDKYGLYDIIDNEFKLSPNNNLFSYVPGLPIDDINETISLLPATTTTLGGVKIGEGLSIDQDGYVSSKLYEAGQGIVFDEAASEDQFKVRNLEYYFDNQVSWQINGSYGPRTFTRLPGHEQCLIAIVQTTSGGQIWTTPACIGLTETSCKYSNSYDSHIIGPDATFNYKGYTWYIGMNYGLLNSTGVDLLGNVQGPIDLTSIDTANNQNLDLVGKAIIDLAGLIVYRESIDVWNSGTGWLNGAYNDSQSDQFWTNWYYTYHSKQNEYLEVPAGAIKMRLIGISNENDSRLQGGGVDCFNSSHHHFTSVGCVTDEWFDIPEGTIYLQFGVKWNELNDRTISSSDIKSVTIEFYYDTPRNDTINAKLGNGLEFDSNDAIQVKLGDGLGFDANGALEVTGGGGGGDSIDEGDGITIITDSQTGVKTIGINVGVGLEIDPNTGALGVAPGVSGNYSAGEAIEFETVTDTHDIVWNMLQMSHTWVNKAYTAHVGGSFENDSLCVHSDITPISNLFSIPQNGTIYTIEARDQNDNLLHCIVDYHDGAGNHLGWNGEFISDPTKQYTSLSSAIYISVGVVNTDHSTPLAISNVKSVTLTWKNVTETSTEISVKYGTGLSVDPITNELFVDGQLPEGTIIKKLTYVGDGGTTNSNIHFSKKPLSILSLNGLVGQNYGSVISTPIDAPYLHGVWGGSTGSGTSFRSSMSYDDTTNTLSIQNTSDVGLAFNISGTTYTMYYLTKGHAGSGTSENNEVSVVKTFSYVGTGTATNNIQFPETPDMILKISGPLATGDITTAPIEINHPTTNADYMTIYTQHNGGSNTTNVGYGTFSFNDSTNVLTLTGGDYGDALNYSGGTYYVQYIVNEVIASSNYVEGDGIEIDPDTGEISVNIGTGLAFDPQTGAINVTGGGGGSGDTVAQGAGIEITTDQQTGNKVIAVNAGTGLQVNQTTNELEIDDSVVTEDDELNLVFVPDDYQPS